MYNNNKCEGEMEVKKSVVPKNIVDSPSGFKKVERC